MDTEDYLPALHRENARFAEAAAAAAVLAGGWTTPVPGCPDWHLADLIWHLAEVQHFWAWVVRTRAGDPSGYVEPARVNDGELLGFQAAQSAELAAVLAGAEPAERVWTWAPQQDVAFVLRRQVQEATVHRVDAEQVLGEVTPIPAAVGLDGVDEWLEVMVPGALPAGPPADAEPVVLHATDADAERTLFAGTAEFPVAALTGTAGDLLLAVWRRLPLSVLTVDGDAARAAALIDAVRPD